MKYDPRHIVLRALTTEKSLNLRESQHCYAFEVAADANRLEIGRAVAELFKVEVTDVRTMNVRGKTKRLGRFEGKRPAGKKAYVTIRPGGHIELFEKT
ncbi:MAG TPA: 50S ribosomal protein L23 [candidate division Zixibacteria bacterium]|jgi:large subunit ribosomal protein L23